MQSLHVGPLAVNPLTEFLWDVFVEQQLDESRHIVFDVLVYLALDLTGS